MRFILKSSLEQIALFNVAVALWNQDDVKHLISKCRSLSFGEWQEIEIKVQNNLQLLPLPFLYKKNSLIYVKQVGIQILKWMLYHKNKLNTSVLEQPIQFYWTSQGTIDRRRTAQKLLKHQSIHIFDRYKLACIYCLTDDILVLFEQLPEEQKNCLLINQQPPYSNEKLIYVWTYVTTSQINALNEMIKAEWRGNCPIYQFAYEYSIMSGNKVAAEYFLQNLTYNERNESFVRPEYLVDKHRGTYRTHEDFLKEHCSDDVFYFLLSQAEDEEQQIEILKLNPTYILECLLDWKWQPFFLEAATRLVCNDLGRHDFESLLKTITDKILYGYRDYDYQELFKKFWSIGPCWMKNSVIRKWTHVATNAAQLKLLLRLLEAKDRKNISLILECVTSHDKNRLIFNNGKFIFDYLVPASKWSSLKFILNECVHCKDTVASVRQKYKKYIRSKYSDRKFRKCIDIFNNLAKK